MSDGPPDSRDSKSNLLEAAQAAVRDGEEKAAAAAVAAAAPAPRKRIGVLAAIAVIGVVILALQPVWLTGPKALAPEPAPVVAASLRLALLRERSRVFDYAKAHGRLPKTLQEAGGTVPAIRYQQTGQGEFKLWGNAGDSLIVLQSSDSVGAFLGQSLRIIKNRGRS